MPDPDLPARFRNLALVLADGQPHGDPELRAHLLRRLAQYAQQLADQEEGK